MRGFEAAASAVLWVVVVAGMAQLSVEHSLKHHLGPLIENINQQATSYIGLIMETSDHEKPLLDSGLYVPNEGNPNITISGRTLQIGKLNGIDVIYVKTEGGVISAASSAQLLADFFNIKGFVHYGIVGSVNDTLFIGDVVIPSQVAYVANLQWKKYGSKGTLEFGDYNLPEEGENSLGAITFEPTKVFITHSGIAEKVFWLPINSTWADTANNLQGVKVEQCISSKKCLPSEPKIVNGLKAASSDIYVQNAALRDFVNTQFKVSVVDKSSAMVLWVALTVDIPVVVFKGVSNSAGGSTAYSSYKSLASVNAFNAAANFVAAIGNPAAASRVMK
ncbi:Phosphorylase superfamily protein [Euphorbia peplus]|nr:Phosphorylase superfamily protein [Euphorbia peplus]